MNPIAVKQTLCWSCVNATGNCEWSEYKQYKPVPGWTAVKTQVKNSAKGTFSSYYVLACPKYVKDPPRQKKKEETENA